MTDDMTSLFLEGLAENDTGKLLRVPKSDLHNHSTKGCRIAWLAEHLHREFPKPPERFDGLAGMQSWFVASIKPYCSDKDGFITRWEGSFAEAQRNNITRLSMNFGNENIDLVGGMESFVNIIDGLRLKYCPDAIFEPELTYGSSCCVEEECEKIDEYISGGFFKALDICGGENVQPFEAFIPLYRKAERYGLIKRMHVGESGSAEDVRQAVDTLGLDEVHHGINAAASPSVMRFLADNHIQLNVCPSSNVMLGYAADYKDHPIRRLYDNGVSVTINTDDLLLFDSSVENEYLLLYRAGALSAEQLNDIRLNGLNVKSDRAC